MNTRPRVTLASPGPLRTRRWAFLAVAGVLVAATVALAIVTSRLVDTAEQALLDQRAREGAMVLQSIADGLELPLQSAVAVSGPDGGDHEAFRASMSPMLRPTGRFDGAALLGGDLSLLASVGEVEGVVDEPLLADLSRSARGEPGRAASALRRRGDVRHLDLAVAAPPSEGSHVVYASLAVGTGAPIERREEAFEDVDFALYFGLDEDLDSIVLRSTEDLPLDEPRATESVWLGTEEMVLVMAPRRPLLGGVTENLPWIVAASGLCVAAAAAVLVDGVARRRDEALQRSAALEREVEARTAELSSANQELEAFAYSVSHDLRAPLRAIDGFTLAVLEDQDGALPPEARSDLRRVRRATQRMGELIDDLLTLSRVSRQSMGVQPVDLSAEARAVLGRLRASEPGRDVSVTVADGMVARGDPGLLRLALENLLQNAWKFTRDEPSPRIEVGVTSANGQPAFYVRDNGVGFDEAFEDKLFQPFQRLHPPEDFEGTGIGLATVARVVARHGGTVWAEGAVGRGATFYFTCDPQEAPT